MKLVLNAELQKHLGILPLRAKTNVSNPTDIVESATDQPQIESTTAINEMPKPKLEKNEFRLLVKILQAIGHDCVFDKIVHKSGQVIYHHPKKALVFDDINTVDDKQTMHLSSLKDMNSNPKLKRAVWEKLKTLS